MMFSKVDLLLDQLLQQPVLKIFFSKVLKKDISFLFLFLFSQKPQNHPSTRLSGDGTGFRLFFYTVDLLYHVRMSHIEKSESL
ncbi:hypothetical protein CO051_06170 [Candidatus Roizmanbacteria bacterium CG_4_9_14_0_2_um_filter_39_13]|uniref:Uncharacterized protein n=1 Tax=Candidatus Roizmanbacteria bacterium CG_4_9_14_0_2_um_filter_39_13 TaxID=1974839 RepID=A0A2M8EWW9_9BACT|nr:MAG: hypothetical protein CO051_06170 [Candidatus Roizmanbacteria bacterium CG_4_9_14_0_2_um_filter_39_13]